MVSNILPLNLEPPAKCYLFDAIPLSIMANHNQYIDWFFSNYIQISSYVDSFNRNRPFFDFFERRQAFKSPWLVVKTLSWEALIQAQTDIIDLLIDHINSGYYFYGYVDEFFIPDRPTYQEWKLPHDNLVYGFNLKEKSFHVAGYNKTGHYSVSKVEFSEFEKAFKNNDHDKNVYFWEDQIMLCKYNPNAFYPLNLKQIAELLDDYLNSRNSYEKYQIENKQLNRVFGMKVYEDLSVFLEAVLVKEVAFDIRQVYLLWEHKKCMLERMKYIQRFNHVEDLVDLPESYKYIEEGFKNYIGLMIKYSITQNPRLLRKIIDSSAEMLVKEKEILGSLLTKICAAVATG